MRSGPVDSRGTTLRTPGASSRSGRRFFGAARLAVRHGRRGSHRRRPLAFPVLNEYDVLQRTRFPTFGTGPTSSSSTVSPITWRSIDFPLIATRGTSDVFGLGDIDCREVEDRRKAGSPSSASPSTSRWADWQRARAARLGAHRLTSTDPPEDPRPGNILHVNAGIQFAGNRDSVVGPPRREKSDSGVSIDPGFLPVLHLGLDLNGAECTTADRSSGSSSSPRAETTLSPPTTRSTSPCSSDGAGRRGSAWSSESRSRLRVPGGHPVPRPLHTDVLDFRPVSR